MNEALEGIGGLVILAVLLVLSPVLFAASVAARWTNSFWKWEKWGMTLSIGQSHS
ncbi:hypothetical protein [Streptomyces chrestomyceticus]|uniref:hypothetical protein n=1 Tax=Streptomyces chrestomyceticus TaxID=68185 RepID=UPI003403324F